MGACTSVFKTKAMNAAEKELKDQENLRNSCSKEFKAYEKVRDDTKNALYEKYGMITIIAEKRKELMTILAKKDALLNERQPLMDRTWELDCDEIHKAFNENNTFGTDKAPLVKIICTRSKWQLEAISVFYQKKYGMALLEQCTNDLGTAFGTLVTGKQTAISRLFVLRIMHQPERDSAILRDFTNRMYIEDENIMEVIVTRTNAEMRAAMELFKDDYELDFNEIIAKKCSYKNYREFMLRVLECMKDETHQPFSDEEAKEYADELYEAGAGRMLGCDPEPFIRICSIISKQQFESINEKYNGKCLLKDIEKKLGGDFGMAVKSMCTDKHEYLAGRLELALKGKASQRADSISRILGCVSRADGVKIRDAYDRGDFGRNLITAMKTTLKDSHFLEAVLLLIDGDLSKTPLGSNREEGEDAAEAIRDGDRAVIFAKTKYNPYMVREKGKHKPLKEIDEYVENEALFKYTWTGGKDKMSDQLQAELDKFEAASKVLGEVIERVKDDLSGILKSLKYYSNFMIILLYYSGHVDVYYSIIKHVTESETWVRILTNQLKALKEFVVKRGNPNKIKK